MSSADIADIIWPWVIWATTLDSSSTQHFQFSIISLWALLITLLLRLLIIITTLFFSYSNSFSVSHFKQYIYKYTNTAKLLCQRCGHSLHLNDTQAALFVTLEHCRSEMHQCWKQTWHRHANSVDNLSSLVKGSRTCWFHHVAVALLSHSLILISELLPHLAGQAVPGRQSPTATFL